MTDKVTQACPSGCQTAAMMLNAASGFQVRYVQCGCGWRSQEHVDADGSIAEQKAITAWNRRTNTNAELVEALREAETVFSLVEHPAVPDPDYQARIEALGSQIGYGAIMAGASAAWRKCGIIPGGEFVAGPCQATVTRTLGMIRKALSLYSDRGEE